MVGDFLVVDNPPIFKHHTVRIVWTSDDVLKVSFGNQFSCNHGRLSGNHLLSEKGEFLLLHIERDGIRMNTDHGTGGHNLVVEAFFLEIGVFFFSAVVNEVQ